MRAEKVSLDQVMEVTSQALDAGLLQFSPGAVIGTGGFVETPNQRISVRARHADPHAGRPAPRSRSRAATARELRIGDVAQVVRRPRSR